MRLRGRALADDLDLARVHAALEQLGASGREVGDDELETLERAWLHFRGTTPSPITIEQPEPGGVSCTTRMPSPMRVSWSTANPRASA